MAGIAFQLRRLSQSTTYAGKLGAYASAAVISAGPWMISIVALMLLTYLLHQKLDGDTIRLFNACVTHDYAIALILTGPIQLLLTRYVADQLSVNEPHHIFPSFCGGLIVTTLIAGAVGCAFFLGMVEGPSWELRAAAATLLVYVSCIFVANVYLSVLRAYQKIVFAFFTGYGVGVAAAWHLATDYGVTGAMIGLLIGHLLLFLILAWNIRRELGQGRGSPFRFLRAAVQMPDLLWIGLFYNLGIWIDKVLFWWNSQSRIEVAGVLHAAPDYDLAIYLSLLSIVPGMTVFILEVETSFAEKFQHYHDAVNHGKSLTLIREAKKAIILSLRTGFLRLLKVQGIATLILVASAGELTRWFHVSFIQLGIFRITLFGAFMLMAFLAMLTVLFYFNDRRGALICTAVFLVANGLLSALTILQNEAWYGFGFVVASSVALLIAAVRVNARLDDLEYYTFNPEL
ncbi:MAG: exopolysaccharide Pel transporter PelG [Verrucomicrobiaceae bacterium]|nr:exopolysaccharide Pel transporter PelG [Verrucomicrobiaceae bacterium]